MLRACDSQPNNAGGSFARVLHLGNFSPVPRPSNAEKRLDVMYLDSLMSLARLCLSQEVKTANCTAQHCNFE